MIARLGTPPRRRSWAALPVWLVMATSMMLAACEMPEETQKRTERDQDQDRPEWTRLTAADIAERWQVLPGSTGGSASSTAAAVTGDLAASTDDSLRSALEIEDARRYGTCDVFTARIRGADHIVFAFLDCVDHQENLPGHYHVAAACGFEWNRAETWETPHFHIIVVRAGQQKHSEGVTVSATLGGKPFDLVWQGRAEAGDVTVDDADWAYLTTITASPYDGQQIQPNEAHDHFRDSIKPGDRFNFTLAQQGGSFEFKSNDSPAVQEYERRCTVLAATPPAQEGTE